MLGAWLLFATPAHAQLQLRWHAPGASCPTQAEVEGEVRRLVGTEPLATYEAEAVIRHDARWELTLRAAGGERRLEADSCRALGEAAALILALAIDPSLAADLDPDAATDADVGGEVDEPPSAAEARSEEPPTSLAAPRPGPRGSEGPEPERGPVTPGPPAPASEPSEASRPSEASEPSQRPPSQRPPSGPSQRPPPTEEREPARRPALWIGATVELGSLPKPALGLEVGLTSSVARRGRLGLGLVGALPRTTTVDDARADLWLVGLRATLGYRLRYGALELTPFGAAEAGAMGGRAQGVSRPLTGWSPWLAAGAGLELALRPTDRFSMAVQGDLRLPIWRPAFVIEGVGQAHRAPATVGRLALRVSFRL